jgi:hypothetical protein
MSDDFGNNDDTLMRADLDSVFSDDVDDLDIFSTDGDDALSDDEDEDEDADF